MFNKRKNENVDLYRKVIELTAKTYISKLKVVTVA